jgi:hypothetical protein
MTQSWHLYVICLGQEFQPVTYEPQWTAKNDWLQHEGKVEKETSQMKGNSESPLTIWHGLLQVKSGIKYKLLLIDVKDTS